MNLTIDEAIAQFGVQVDEHLDRQATIPVLGGLQFQGDVAIIPSAAAGVTYQASTPLPAGGYPVVRGENGANTHQLIAAGTAYYDPATRSGGTTSLDLGVLTVPQGSTAYLAHPEHAYAGIAPGTYQLRRQREQADEIRLVAD